MEDKQKVGTFVAVAPPDLQYLGQTDWIDINRGDTEYFELGLKKIARVLQAPFSRAAAARPPDHMTRNATRSRPTGPPLRDRGRSAISESQTKEKNSKISKFKRHPTAIFS